MDSNTPDKFLCRQGNAGMRGGGGIPLFFRKEINEGRGQGEAIPMIEKTPYIIVDNRKLLPINRLQPPRPASNRGPERRETPFGVIDRVTISAEAREKSRRYQACRATAPIAEQAPSNQVAPAPSALLTDASLKRNPDDPSQ